MTDISNETLDEVERAPIIIIDLQEGLHWGDCPICGEYRRMDHAVAWYCGPTHDEIGSVTTEYTDGGIVGGKSVCKSCHDAFYANTARRDAFEEAAKVADHIMSDYAELTYSPHHDKMQNAAKTYCAGEIAAAIRALAEKG